MDGFWECFGVILEAFCEGFGGQTMIRATKGISMDGWRRLTHMRSHMDASQAMPPRFVGGFHSVAQQASFNIASGSDLKGLWSDLGRFWEAQMDAKRGF